MRTLILGAGGTGGYFGGRMAAAGSDVTFLVRPRRAAELAETGLVIESPRGGVRLPVRTVTAAPGPFDLVILTCKAYDLPAAMDAIAPAVGDSTFVLPLLNGLRHLDDLDERFGPQRVLGGLCHIGATLGAGGIVQHLNRLERVTLGPRSPGQADPARAAARELARGGFELRFAEDVMQALWEKYVFLAAYAALTCLMRAPIGAIMATDEGRSIALELFAECCAVATAAGHPPGPECLDSSHAMLTDPRSPGTASMLRDLQAGGRTEHEHVFGDLLRRARAFGQEPRILRLAQTQLQAYAVMRSESGRAGA